MNTSLWSNISDAQAQSERGVRWVYLWLLISAFITVPWMLWSVWSIREDSHDPTWSPDGKRIAFSSNRDGNLEIYVMNADGSQQTRLTNNSSFDDYPAWSPDGKRIAFTSYRDRKYEIYVMNADGSGMRQLTEQPLAPFLSAVLLPALVHVILVLGVH